MALTTCPECGNKISDAAASCPQCGFPMKDYLQYVADKQQEQEIENQRLEEEERIRNKTCPECGEIVGEVEVCPFCGVNIFEKEEMDRLNEEQEKDEGEQTEIKEEDDIDTDALEESETIYVRQTSAQQWSKVNEDKKKKRTRTAIIVVIVVVVIIVLIAVGYYRAHSYTRAKNAADKAHQEYQDAQSKLDSLERQKSAVEAEIDAIESNR